MKTAKDPRHIHREKIVKVLFSSSFKNNQKQNLIAEGILKEKENIDKTISKAAPEWPLSQINRVDLAILRLAVWELSIEAKEPPKVIIDEAVELAKKYGSERSPNFINGVLGTIFKNFQAKKQ